MFQINWIKQLLVENELFEIEKIVWDLNEFEANLTGFGKTIIDYVEMHNSGLNFNSMVRLLNNIFITIQTTPNKYGEDQ